jgi:hypothetical protein
VAKTSKYPKNSGDNKPLFIPSSALPVPVYSRFSYVGLDQLFNSNYFYALDLKMPKNTSLPGLPGFFGFGVPSYMFTPQEIQKRRETAYLDWNSRKACTQMKVLLKIDGLIERSQISLAELEKPTRHYIGILTSILLFIF